MLNAFFLVPRITHILALSKILPGNQIQDPQKRSALLQKVIEQIWNSRELHIILQTAVMEIASILELKKCSFLWYFQHTKQVQVVCQSDDGGADGSEIGYYPLEKFGGVATAIAEGKLLVKCDSTSSPNVLGTIANILQQLRSQSPTEDTREAPATETTLGNTLNLLVPVKGQEGWLGFIACASEKERGWSAAEVEFVQLIAQQLEIAIRQAQLYEKVKKQAQRERLLNQIVRQTRSSFDLETILTGAIEQLLQALEIDRCIVHLVEEQDKNEALCRDTKSEIDFRRSHLLEVCRPPYTPSIDDFDTHGPITEWTIAHRRPVVIPDVTKDPRIGEENQEYQKAAIKSSMVMPVAANGKLHAILYMNQCSQRRSWSKNDRELAAAVADQLAISIQQAGLYAQTRASMEREALLRLIGDRLSRTLDLETILQTIIREVLKLLHADRAAIYQFATGGEGKVVVEELASGKGDSWLPKLPPNSPGNRLAEETPLPGSCPPKLSDCHCFGKDCWDYTELYQQGWVRAIDNVCEADFAEEKLACWQQLQITASLHVPILISSNLWGLLLVQECSGPRQWRQTEIDLLQQLALQLSMAIHQAELYDKARTAAEVAERKAQELEIALHQLSSTQSQLIQSEKMSSLGQMVAGIAHEINNPVNFIYGNISHVDGYTHDLLKLVELYQKHHPAVAPEIEACKEDIDLEFLREDLPKILASMKIGTDRIREIVLSLKNFSRLDQADMKPADIHSGIDSTLLILQNRLNPKSKGEMIKRSRSPKVNCDTPEIEIIKEYGDIPRTECYPGQLNQVFMNILANAIDALETHSEESMAAGIFFQPQITIRTSVVLRTSSLSRFQGIQDGYTSNGKTETANEEEFICISITDNGPGIKPEDKSRLFDPFYTTKPVGKGTGLGLSISYQIVVERHGGSLQCISELGQGAEFRIEIPLRRGATHNQERQLVEARFN
ncbi:GAF domain-containing protein [[Phormidium] sp. ETS-05]|uniref:GAF domain-containing protein n=1 Tax=[Phormidium] sp. ETS-05 TaxID=222819 RepID=UPI0018EEECE7|nr:GAF domain-containing protein [[Phormidium] sp. ETS-05]